MNTNWKYATFGLTIALMLSWTLFFIDNMLQGDSRKAIHNHQTALIEQDRQIAVLRSQIEDLRARDRQLATAIENLSAQRARDYEFLSSQINRTTVKRIR